jgi:zinc transport system ATP-binding protein
MTQIELNNVTFAYDRYPVVRNVTFSITQREIVAIVGPNGGGKTTLLRLILGLEKPQQGTVNVLGSTPHKARSLLGYVPQQTMYDPQFPICVRDVVRMGVIEQHPFGFFSKKDTRAAMDALETMELSHLHDAPFTALSGGQKQRVLIARALVSSPSILLLDEPTAHVDQQTSQQLYNTLKQLGARMTIVFVSHDVGVVSTIATSVLCVNHTTQFHPTRELTGESIGNLYGSEMALVRHDHRCDIRNAANE